MILIPDVHISAKQGEKILQILESIFSEHDDKQIMFLGDYIYMFSYDRSMLLRLFDLFVTLYQQGRSVTVMAGNHDRLGWHFVFEEGKQAFDIINKLNLGPKLQFLTQPYHRVQDEVLHVVLPYNDQVQEPQASEYYDPSVLSQAQDTEIIETIETLRLSSRPWDRLSAMINLILLTYYETNKTKFKKIICYHHYYTATVQFPGLQNRFNYQDGAFSPLFCRLPWLYMISWHIHEPFSYENYLCCGSLRHTSSNEQDECKYYFIGDPSVWFTAHMIQLNPKLSFEAQTIEDVSLGAIQNKAAQVVEESMGRMIGPLITSNRALAIDLSKTDIYIQTDGILGTALHIEELEDHVASYKIIKKIQVSENMFSSSISNDFRTSFADWKLLLSDYLHYKYPDRHDSYIDFLKLNGII